MDASAMNVRLPIMRLEDRSRGHLRSGRDRLRMRLIRDLRIVGILHG